MEQVFQKITAASALHFLVNFTTGRFKVENYRKMSFLDNAPRKDRNSKVPSRTNENRAVYRTNDLEIDRRQ